MKYIKLYESFNIEELRDCFLDIIDEGFEVDISNNLLLGLSEQIYITITKQVYVFNYYELKECLLFAVPYIQEKYKFSNVNMYAFQYGSWVTTDIYLNEYIHRKNTGIGGNVSIPVRKLYPYIGGFKLVFNE